LLGGGVRIVVDGRYINDGFPGIARYAFNLVRALGALDGGDELLVLTNRELPNSRFDLAELEGLPRCRLVECGIQRFLPSELLQLPRVVARLRPTVFHSPFFLRPYPLQSPCVVSLHDVIPLHRSYRASGPLDRMVFRIGARLACATAAAILTVTRAAARAIAAWYAPAADRLSVVPLAPDPRFRPQPPEVAERMRSKLGLCRPYVLHVGSHVAHKNVATLIEAWARLRQTKGLEAGDHELVLAGRSAPDGSLRRRVTRHGLDSEVRFLGEVEEGDMAALYGAADLFVFPSLVEGYGLPVVEAMACGTPVVCSDDPALRELADDAALAVRAGDPAALAEAVRALLASDHRRRALAADGLARCARLSWRATAEATLDVYRRAAGAH
jgi:alpha-1,3-rhamnosyl/mannosyltransferase